MREFKVPTKGHNLDDLLWFTNERIIRWYEFNDPYKQYGAVRATGKFKGNFDYNVGLVVMRIGTWKYVSNVFVTRVIITNIDDGAWEAYSKEFSTKEESEVLTERIYEDYVKFEDNNYGSVLPSEEELNHFLMPFGLYGSFVG